MLPGRKGVCRLLLGWENLWCFFPFLLSSSSYSAFSMSSPEQTRVSDSSMWWESQGGHFSLRMTAFTHWIVHEGSFPRPWSHFPSPSLPFHAVLYSGHGSPSSVLCLFTVETPPSPTGGGAVPSAPPPAHRD